MNLNLTVNEKRPWNNKKGEYNMIQTKRNIDEP